MFAELYDHVTPAVLAKAGSLARLGYTPQDCLQEAAGKILALLARPVDLEDPGWPAYVKRAVVNHLESLRRAGETFEHGEQELPVAEPLIAGLTVTEWDDLLESAPGHVRHYLQSRVLDGQTWEDYAEDYLLTNEQVAENRRAAADYVLAQLEGRKL